MQGKYYPLRIRRLKYFHKTHTQKFDQFAQTIPNKRLFPSELEVCGVERDLSSTGENEHDLWLNVRSAIEKPVERVVRAYMDLTGNSDRFYFKHHAYSPHKKDIENSDEEQHGPDRWGIREIPNEEPFPTFVGTYNAADRPRTEGIRQALDSSSANSFQETLKQMQSSETISEQDITRKEVIQLLSQAFHHMVKIGLQYGYVTLGEAVFLLRTRTCDPGTLWYYLHGSE